MRSAPSPSGDTISSTTGVDSSVGSNRSSRTRTSSTHAAIAPSSGSARWPVTPTRRRTGTRPAVVDMVASAYARVARPRTPAYVRRTGRRGRWHPMSATNIRATAGDTTSDRLVRAIDALDMSEKRKEWMRDRWLDQVQWFDRRALRANRRYSVLRIVAITGGVL